MRDKKFMTTTRENIFVGENKSSVIKFIFPLMINQDEIFEYDIELCIEDENSNKMFVQMEVEEGVYKQNYAISYLEITNKITSVPQRFKVSAVLTKNDIVTYVDNTYINVLGIKDTDISEEDIVLQLDTPILSGYKEEDVNVLFWNSIKNASYYIVYCGDKKIKTQKTTIQLLDADIIGSSVYVRAFAEDFSAYKSSANSNQYDQSANVYTSYLYTRNGKPIVTKNGYNIIVVRNDDVSNLTFTTRYGDVLTTYEHLLTT
jgi:hypothetical protein